MKTFTHRILMSVSATALLVLGACHKSNTPTVTTPVLVYTDPTSGTYRLVRDTVRSTSTRLVLNLVGPAGTAGRGIAFALQLSGTPDQKWTKVDTGDAQLVQNKAFNLGPGARSIFTAKAAPDGTLQVAICQKGDTAPAIAFGPGVPLVSLAIETPALSDPPRLVVPKDSARVWAEDGTLNAVDLSVGTLKVEQR